MKPLISEEDLKILENESYTVLKTILENGCKICGNQTVEFSSNIELNETVDIITKSWFLEIECLQCNDKYIHMMEMNSDDRIEYAPADISDRQAGYRQD